MNLKMCFQSPNNPRNYRQLGGRGIQLQYFIRMFVQFALRSTLHSWTKSKILLTGAQFVFFGGLCKCINCGFYIFLSLKVLPQASRNQSLKVSSLLRPERSLRPLCWRFVGADAQLECSKAMRRDGWDGLHHVAPWIEIPRPLQIVWDGRNNWFSSFPK